VVDFIEHIHQLTELPKGRLLQCLGLQRRKYSHWAEHYGKVHEDHALIARDTQLEPQERQAIIDYARAHPHHSYRTLTYMMMDEDVVAVSPSTTYRVLKSAHLVPVATGKPSKKGTGFVQPLAPHEHWHTDFSYINIGGTFYFLCSVLDGCSRAILAWDIRPTMCQKDAQIVIQRAREAYPQARPRLITDQGAQYKSKEFQQFIQLWSATHVMTSPYYPQSNGKLERFHLTLKHQAIHPQTPLTLDDAQRITQDFIDYYNSERLHSSIGYITPADRLEGRHLAIHAQRELKLASARHHRKLSRQQASNSLQSN
jgi:putative transposase